VKNMRTVSSATLRLKGLCFCVIVMWEFVSFIHLDAERESVCVCVLRWCMGWNEEKGCVGIGEEGFKDRAFGLCRENHEKGWMGRDGEKWGRGGGEGDGKGEGATWQGMVGQRDAHV